MSDRQQSVPAVHPAEWPTACIGPGRVGTALTRALHGLGFPIMAVGGGDGTWAGRLAEEVGAQVVDAPYEGLGEDIRLVTVTTPDSAFGQVARELAGSAHLRAGTILLHTSATEPASVLRARREDGSSWLAEGVRCLSMHPMRPFPDRQGTRERFEDAVLGLEGDMEALPMGRWLARELGGHPVELDTGQKALYHTAGVLAAAGMMALDWAASRIAEQLELEDVFMEKGIRRGMEEVLALVREPGLPEGLTGPISRGDIEVVTHHLEAARRLGPDYERLYRAIARINLEVARRQGRVARERLDALQQLLEEGEPGRKG